MWDWGFLVDVRPAIYYEVLNGKKDDSNHFIDGGAHSKLRATIAFVDGSFMLLDVQKYF